MHNLFVALTLVMFMHGETYSLTQPVTVINTERLYAISK